MSDLDKKLQVVGEGRMAGLAMDHVGALIAEQKLKKMLELSVNFRMGKIDQHILLSSVAGLCALEDLENEMKRRMVRAEKASNDLHKEQLK